MGLRGYCRLPSCNSRRLSSCLAADEGHAPGLANKWVFERPRRSRTRADSAQSARQGGTEPGTTRFKDGRATTGPPAPRRGPGAPAVQPRPRGLDLESAQV